MDIQAYVDSLNLELDVTTRVDCPACGGANTFTVTRAIGAVKWNCYKNSCKIRGVNSNVDLSASEMMNMLYKSDMEYKPFEIPDDWIVPTQGSKTLAYLKQNHCLSAYQDKRVDVRYDVGQHRHVFLNWQGGVCVGAVGRKENSYMQGPKWYFYNKETLAPLVVPQYGSVGFPDYPTGKRGVIVEDAASACAVSVIQDGIALLGTHMVPDYIKLLSSYDQLTVALDPDAQSKAMDIARHLGYYTDVRVVMISDDIKYMEPEQILEEVA